MAVFTDGTSMGGIRRRGPAAGRTCARLHQNPALVLAHVHSHNDGPDVAHSDAALARERHGGVQHAAVREDVAEYEVDDVDARRGPQGLRQLLGVRQLLVAGFWFR